HRHVVGLRDRLFRRACHAPHPSPRRAAFSRSVRPAHADPGHRLLPVADVLAAVGKLAAAGGLAGDRHGDLFRLQPASQPPGQAAAGDWRCEPLRGRRPRTGPYFANNKSAMATAMPINAPPAIRPAQIGSWFCTTTWFTRDSLSENNRSAAQNRNEPANIDRHVLKWMMKPRPMATGESGKRLFVSIRQISNTAPIKIPASAAYWALGRMLCRPSANTSATAFQTVA